MPTKKPKIQGYVDELIHERFQEWKRERLVESDTEALSQILAEYFGLGTSSALIIQKKEAVEEFLPKLREELKREILEEINHQLEPIKSWLGKLDDNYGALLKYVAESPLLEQIKALNKRIGEIESQARMERESPQLGLNEEAIQSVWMQEEVIKTMQLEIDSLRDSFRESPSDIPIDTPNSIPFTHSEFFNSYEIDAVSSTPEDLNPEIAEQESEILIEHRAAKIIQVLEAEFGSLNREELKEFPEQDLMDIIFARNDGIDIEEAETVYRLIKGDSSSDPPEESEAEKFVDEEELLNHTELSQRLKTNKNTLRRKRKEESFKVWSQQRDPFGLVWEYISDAKVYRGIKVSSV